MGSQAHHGVTMDIKSRRINCKVHSGRYSWPELKALVIADMEIRLGDTAAERTFSITVKQEERGSPSYYVDEWTARVEVVDTFADDQ